MSRVIVSAGHTNKEPGAIFEDFREVDLTRKIAHQVTNKLRDIGIITISIPPELELPAKIEWINKTGYSEESDDICIEIHINDGGKSGIEGWYKDKGENDSYKLTKSIVEGICNLTKLTNQGIKSEYDHPLKSLAFLHNTNPTSALIECLYIDNPEDRKFLKDDSKLDLLATGIVNGIKNYLGVKDNIDTPPGSSTSMGINPQQPRPLTQTPQFNKPLTNQFPSTGLNTNAPYTPYSSTQPYNSNLSKQPQNREDRKKMIEHKYHQILGRKVSNQDLNYFLNLNLSENQMIKRLVESQDHADLVKESQEYKKIKPKYDKQKIENKELKSKIQDKDAIIKQQNDLIAQKNKSIQQLQKNHEEISLPQEKEQQVQPTITPQQPNKQYRKENFIDRILNKLNNIFD